VKGVAVALAELTQHLDQLLEPARFTDYAPNGLQVEGRADITRIVTAVSANQAAIDATIDAGADAMVVHHGFFWRNEERTIVGYRARRLAALLANEISVLAYHLPLDAHPVVGNNVGLLRALGAEPVSPFAGQPPIGWIGELDAAVAADVVLGRIEAATGRPPLAFGAAPTAVRRIGAVSGGGAGYYEEAVANGAELFVTGEPSEMAQGLAAEIGVPFVAAGHHGTERFGPRALGEHLAAIMAVDVRFVDVDNPV
jgi:dinuclear metal center YbgI/SA1388 family protein